MGDYIDELEARLEEYEAQILTPSMALMCAEVRVLIALLEEAKKQTGILEVMVSALQKGEGALSVKANKKVCPDCGKEYAGKSCPCKAGKGKKAPPAKSGKKMPVAPKGQNSAALA